MRILCPVHHTFRNFQTIWNIRRQKMRLYKDQNVVGMKTVRNMDQPKYLRLFNQSRSAIISRQLW